MKTKRLLISLVTMLVTTVSWAGVTINATNFPDYYFRQYLLSQDYGSDSYLSDTEIAKVTNISVDGTYSSPGNITNLKGIEFFTALTYLSCSYNQLTSLDVSKNTKLTILYSDNNQLTSLDVSKNTALKTLNCDNNQITSLNVSKNTALTMLYCRYNQLTSLNVSYNTALTYLGCNNNQLTSLNVSYNTALKTLSCYSNKITSLNVSYNTALTYLDCVYNQITSLDVSKNIELTTLYCYSNKITSLDVSKNTALKTLYCYSNQLTSLNVSVYSPLTALRCYGNQLTSLDLSKNLELTELQCYDNRLTSLDLSKNTKLTTLYCYENQINGAKMDALVKSLPTVSDATTMHIIYYSNEGNAMTTTQVAAAKAKGWTPQYYTGSSWQDYAGYEHEPVAVAEINATNFPDENFRNYLLSQNYGSDGVLTDAEIANMTYISVPGTSSSPGAISSLKGIEFFTAPTTLYCRYNQLTSLDVSKNTALKTLNCDNNQITSLDVTKNTALTKLYCYSNQITSLDVSKNTALTTLNCHSNQITSLDVSKNTALTYLSCHSNQLTSLDVSKNTALTTLYCYSNQIKGSAMDALVKSLPTASSGKIYVIYNENEGNVMTTTQVAAAKAKGWTPQYYTGSSWQEYAGSEDEPVPVEKCATPTISYSNGKLQFSCETEGVEYVYNVTPPSATAGSGSDITLPTTYKITVYATKAGYDNSDVATKDINVGGTGGIRGDVNNDGTVGMPDAMFIVNKVLKGKFPDEKEPTTYYYYAGWTLPTESNMETIINETLPENSGSTTLNNCGKKTTSKSFMDFSLNTLYNVNGRDYYYVLVPEGQTIVDSENVEIIDDYTSLGTITIGNQTHTVYKSNITTRYINDMSIY